jgi:hypothetical protein
MDLVTLSPQKTNWTKFGNILINKKRPFAKKVKLLSPFGNFLHKIKKIAP